MYVMLCEGIFSEKRKNAKDLGDIGKETSSDRGWQCIETMTIS